MKEFMDLAAVSTIARYLIFIAVTRALIGVTLITVGVTVAIAGVAIKLIHGRRSPE